MRRLARFLIRLYPSEWRTRYGEEFSALVEDAPVRVGTIFDLSKGAVQMQSSGRNFPRLALVLCVVGLAAGFGGSYLVTPIYVSEAELTIRDKAGTLETAADRMTAEKQQVLSRTSLKRIIQDPRLNLYSRERMTHPLEDVIERMRTRDIRIIPRSGTRDRLTFEVSFSYPDPHKAQQAVQTLIIGFERVNEETQVDSAVQSDVARLEQRIAAIEQRVGISAQTPDPYIQKRAQVASQLTVLDPPNFPQLPAKPNRTVFAALGFGAGFILAVLIALLRRPLPLPPPQPAALG